MLWFMWLFNATLKLLNHLKSNVGPMLASNNEPQIL